MTRFQIQASDLPSIAFDERLTAPRDVSAVYFVLKEGGEILYIGSAQCLRGRWSQHNKIAIFQHFGAERIAWLACENIRELERNLIAQVAPPLNSLGAVAFHQMKEQSK